MLQKNATPAAMLGRKATVLMQTDGLPEKFDKRVIVGCGCFTQGGGNHGRVADVESTAPSRHLTLPILHPLHARLLLRPSPLAPSLPRQFTHVSLSTPSQEQVTKLCLPKLEA
jgi:hypothetical protein